MYHPTFTPSLFFKHATCPHWIWHDRFSDPSKKGETPALMEKLLDQGVRHEEDYIKDLKFESVADVPVKDAYAQTLKLMMEGSELIYQGEIRFDDGTTLYRGRPDLLEKRPGKSKFGDHYYAPVDIKSSSDIKPEQWMQLTLYAKILEEMQGVLPIDVAIINREHERVDFEIKDKHRVKTFDKIDEILQTIRGDKPPLKLASTCKQSPWYEMCVEEAEQANDIALLYKLNSRAHAGLRENGINTVEDAAHMTVEQLPKIPYATRPTLERIKLQAQALTENKIIWIGRPGLPEHKLNIYFDIEGDPLLNVQYLWGFWVVGDADKRFAKIGNVYDFGDKYFIYFLAEQPEDENAMWNDFLSWLELLPNEDISVFHFHHYEIDQCNALEKRYGGSDALHRFTRHLVDLSVVVQQSVIFPLYFYSIKDIAKSKFLNYKWRHAKAGGAQSIFWYEEWLEKGDRAVLEDIINYNEDDVRATEWLHKWLINNV